MAAPLAVPLAIGVGKGIKIGLGAAWRYGPILLNMADQFQRSPGLAPRTGRAGSQQRLGDLLRDAVAGARVAVATPPPPPLPFNNGPDSWKVPPEIERALRPLLDALQRLGQLWGGAASGSGVTTQPQWGEPEATQIQLESPQTVIVSITTRVTSVTSPCAGGGDTTTNAFLPNTQTTQTDNVISISPGGEGALSGTKPCGDPPTNIPLSSPGVVLALQNGSFSTVGVNAFAGSGSAQEATTATMEASISVQSSSGDSILPPQVVTASELTQPAPGNSQLSAANTRLFALPAASPQISPLLAPQAAATGTSTTPGSGVAGGSLPAVGAVAVPSNPPANWFGQPSTTPGTLPAPLPSVAPTPAYVPRPVPGTSPTGDPAPAPQTEPEPAQVPGTTPAPPTTAPSVPQPGPVAPPLTLPGTVASPAPTPAPTTAPGTHFPVPGAPPVTANGPAPTLKEMAREMGRQEQKLSQLLQRSSQPDGSPVDLGEILRLLLQLLELLNVLDSGGGYQINSPCNVDEETGLLRDPLVTQWGSTIGLKGALVKRIDALADLLQYQKDLPQPICSRKKPTGDFVTVNFEQITNDLETP
jgi:hypothetical protein